MYLIISALAIFSGLSFFSLLQQESTAAVPFSGATQPHHRHRRSMIGSMMNRASLAMKYHAAAANAPKRIAPSGEVYCQGK